MKENLLLKFNYNAGPHEFKIFGKYFYACLDHISKFIKLDYNLDIIAEYIPPVLFHVHSFETFDNTIFWIADQKSDIWKLNTSNNKWIKETNNFNTYYLERTNNYIFASNNYIFASNNNQNTVAQIDKENNIKIIQLTSNNILYYFISLFYIFNNLILTSKFYQQIYLYNLLSSEFKIIDIPLSNKYIFLRSYYDNNKLYLMSSSILDGIDAIVILNNFDINNGTYDNYIIIPFMNDSSLHRIGKLNNNEIYVTATGSSSFYSLKEYK